MADINEILGRNINSVKELKDAIKELQNSLIGVDTESEQYKTTSQQLAAAQEELTKVTNAGKEANNAAKDSIVGLQQEYKNLYDTYKTLSEEERNSPFGKGMAESLASLSEKINTSKKEVGNFTSNIGQYAQGATDAFNKLGISAGGLQKPLSLASTGAKGFNTALKTLSANPIILVITTLVAILAKAAAAIKQNEELSNRLKEAMSVFKPVLDAVANAFDFLAGIIVKVVEGLAKVAEKVMSVIPGMKNAIKSHKDLAKATNDLTKAQREANVENSKKQANVESLRAEAAATTDVIEKQKLLEEAKAQQAEIDQTNIALAQEELRIAEEYAKKTANSAEANDKLAAAQVKVNQAIAQGEANMRQYNKQLTTLTNQENKASGGGGKSKYQQQKEEAQKLYQQLIENNKTEIQKTTEKYEKEKKLLEKFHIDTKLLTKKYNEDIAKLNLEQIQRAREQERQSYSIGLRQANRYFQQQQEILEKTNPQEAIKQRIKQSEDILTAFDRIQEERIRLIKEAGIGPLGNAFTFIFDQLDPQKINDYAAAIDYLKGKVAEYADATEGTFDGIMKKNFNLMIEAIEKLGPEKYGKALKIIQEQVDVLRETFGITMETLQEADGNTTKENLKLKTSYDELVDSILELGYHAGETEEIFDFKSIKDNLKDLTLGLKEVRELNLREELDMISGGFSLAKIDEEKARNRAEYLEQEKYMLQESLINWQGTNEKKIELEQRLYDVQREIAENMAELQSLQTERSMAMIESLVDMTDRLSSALDTMQSSWKSVTDAELNAGKITKKEADKKKKQYLEMEKAATAFAIATILGDLASGSFAIWHGYAQEVGKINPETAAAAGPAAGAALAALNTKSTITAIARQVGLAATATAQIAAAKGKYVASKTSFEGESAGGSVSVAATPALIDSNPYTYTRTVQTTDEEDKLNQPIFVTVTDIEDGLGQRAKVTQETSF